MRGHKQFFVQYESSQLLCGDYTHTAGNASTIRSAKSIIRNIRKNYAEDNPHNFKVYDCWADVEAETNHVPCVYQEE